MSDSDRTHPGHTIRRRLSKAMTKAQRAEARLATLPPFEWERALIRETDGQAPRIAAFRLNLRQILPKAPCEHPDHFAYALA